MRKRVRVLILAAIVAAVVVPMDFALSLESGSASLPLARMTSTATEAAEVANLSPVLLDFRQQSAVFHPSLPFKTKVSDSASLFVLGTVLIGLAIAVRRVS